MISEKAIIDEGVVLRSNVTIWHFAHIREGVVIGANTKIGEQVYIGLDVVIGHDCKIQNGAYIPKGVVILERVFIGPNATFTNDKYPPSDKQDWKSTLVEAGASIGANATILPGVVIRADAIVGAGSVVTKDIPEREIWVGNPAKIIGRRTCL